MGSVHGPESKPWHCLADPFQGARRQNPSGVFMVLLKKLAQTWEKIPDGVGHSLNEDLVICTF